MAKKINPQKVKRSIKSGLDFSKFYFSKSTSVILITTYSAVLFLALAVLGFSSLILPKSVSDDIPSLPKKEPFAFLPADNIEVPALGDVDTPEKPAEEAKSKEAKSEDDKPKEAKPEEPETPAEKEPAVVATPAVVETPVVVVEKEVVKEVVKEVPKEVVKVVEKVVEKEPVKEETKPKTEKPTTEEIHYDNYAAPTDYSSYLDFPDYKDYPDTEE